MIKKVCIILRGLPGSGKSTLASILSSVVFEADSFFVTPEGGYNFDVRKLGLAHKDCITRYKDAIDSDEPLIIVSNTSTKASEFQEYMNIAKEHGYQVFSVIVENRHGNKSVHSVPEETLEKMKDRFDIKL